MVVDLVVVNLMWWLLAVLGKVMRNVNFVKR